MKKVIITALLTLVTLAGQTQVKCHIEGELEPLIRKALGLQEESPTE